MRERERENKPKREESEGESLQEASWGVIYIPQELTMVVVWPQTDNRRR